MDGVQTTRSNDLLPSIFNHQFLFADYLTKLTHIPELLNPNLVETQNIILDPKKRVGALLNFRVQQTRNTCRIFIEMEEVTCNLTSIFLF